MAYRLQYLAEVSGTELVGDPDCRVEGLDVLQSAGESDISFLASPLYSKFLAGTRAAAVILDAQHLPDCPCHALVSDNPYLAYAHISHLFAPGTEPAGIHPSAVVDPSAIIHETAVIGANCIVGRNVRIGAHTRLLGNNTLCADVVIGERCIIHPGAVIGSDGFGLANDQGRWVKIEQLGSVVIGDDVEIGANTTIDRGAIRDTRIADGVKIDNQVQIAHNVEIGEHTAIAGCTGIAGSTRIGARCMLGAGAGVAGHLEIADGVVISAMTPTIRSITEAGQYTGILPALPHRIWQKNVSRLRRLDELAKKVRDLQRTDRDG